jgi:hypothetical protein
MTETPREQSATAAAAPQPSATRARQWWGITIANRAAAVYLLLFSLPILLGHVPGLPSWYEAMMQRVVPWFAEHTLGLANAYAPLATGSGDTQFNYARSWLNAVLAVVLAVAWTLRRPAPLSPRLRLWWADIVRLTLASMLLAYGLAKVIPTQFPQPGAGLLVQPLGEFTPMGLLWAFMGHSTLYQMFGGWCEVLPGVLMLFRRTAFAGALLAIPVLVNVLVLNLTFDVPVKLHAMHYVVMACVIAAPIAPAVLLVLFGRAVPARVGSVQEPWAAPLTRAALILVMLIMRSGEIGAAQSAVPRLNRGGGDPALAGIWDLASRSGAAPPWRILAVDRMARARLDDGTTAWVSLAADTSARTVQVSVPSTLPGPRLRGDLSTWAYTTRGDTLTFWSLAGADSLRLVFRRRDPNSLPLRSAKFRWMQD